MKRLRLSALENGIRNLKIYNLQGKAVQPAECATGIFTLLGTLLGTVLGVFLRELIDWFRRPKLKVAFEHGEPCLFLGRYFRLKVLNKGRSAARNCTAKFSFTEADEKDWRRGEILHWARREPLVYGRDPKRVDEMYSPITIAKDDYELLDVFYLEEATPPLESSEPPKSELPNLYLYSFPWFESSQIGPKVSSTTNLDRFRINKATLYKSRVTVYCDNGSPKTFLFYFKFENGQLHVGEHPGRLKPVRQCTA